jgi:hypothetical protein
MDISVSTITSKSAQLIPCGVISCPYSIRLH